MPVTKVHLAQRAKRELGPAVIDDLRRNMFAVDCQTCGRPLRARPLSVTIDDFGVLAQARLHHETCQEPYWKVRGAIVDAWLRTPTLSYRLFDLLLHLPGGPSGPSERTPVLVVNPSLEAVTLDRSPAGEWRVDTPNFYFKYGFVRGVLGARLREVPGGVARLRFADDGSAPSLTVQIPTGEGWSKSMAHFVANAVDEQRGIVLVITSAVDPSMFALDSFDSDAFDALLTSGICAVGWVSLADVSAPVWRGPARS